MRIQHNIMSMNAYRNYNNNTASLSKNLEKLSSGYKINRAGDDAAGLAISEKMRAQITGLNAAQKNVKDGISLVKTAEGAMQEIQDMLNRMDYLATQSANGTYQNEVDRENLQKEVTALTTEIDRIADSANFNGIKLLDGTQSGSSNGGTTYLEVKGVLGGTVLSGTDVVSTGPTKAKYTFTVDAKDITKNSFDAGVGTVTYTTNDADTNTTAGNLRTALQGSDPIKAAYDISGTGSNVILTAKTAGVDANATKIKGNVEASKLSVVETAKGADAVAAHKTYDMTGTAAVGDELTIDGVTYKYAKNADGSDGIHFKDVTTLVAAAKVNGVTLGTTNAATATKSGGGLTLQIGDSKDSFNQMSVSITSMKKDSLGISSVNIGSQTGAQAAIDTIKNAINKVSSTRGDLGAIQNRLEHTQKNLSVMAENIQDAESTIRDTDVADEMMAYTKNNILIQSAQAMLAQANAVPQGVLQLLQ